MNKSARGLSTMGHADSAEGGSADAEDENDSDAQIAADKARMLDEGTAVKPERAGSVAAVIGNAAISPLFPLATMHNLSVPSITEAKSSTGRLFPIFPQVAGSGITTAAGQDWLANPSFSKTLLPLREKFTATVAYNEGQRDTGRTDEVQKIVDQNKDELFSSGSDKSSGEKQKRSEKKKKKRKRKEGVEGHTGRERKGRKSKHKRRREETEIGSLEGLGVERKPAVKIWADSTESLPKVYFFDTRGDRDNLAFGSLYALDVARYHRHLTTTPASTHISRLRFGKHGPRGSLGDDDIDFTSRPSGTIARNRYWTGKQLALEKSKDFKRLRAKVHFLVENGKGRNSEDLWGEYVPLDEAMPKPARHESSSGFEERNAGEILDNKVEGESWEEQLLRRTKEFNEKTRERPMDASVWLDFARFQDEYARWSIKATAVQQAVEKKIAVYEKALHYLPDNEELQVAYLETCRNRDEVSALQSKWEKAVERNPGSYLLWHEYIRWRRAQFSTFSVSAVREMFVRAIHALGAERNYKRREAHSSKEHLASNREFVKSEGKMVEMFLEACRFEWQCGHHERAIGMIQAEIEYAVFAPPLEVSEGSKQRLFEAFWDGGFPHIGEEGSLGWSAFVELQEELLLRAQKEEAEETGGWTGWKATDKEEESGGLGPHQSAGVGAGETNQSTGEAVRQEETIELEKDSEAANSMEERENDGDNTEDDTASSNDGSEEDDAALAERLGLGSGGGKEDGVKDEKVWLRWAEEEVRRDKDQWLPVRPTSGKTSRALTRTREQSDTNGEAEVEEELELERAVLYEDVREVLFSLESEEARALLLHCCVDFCDGPLPPWHSTNESSAREKIEAQEWADASSLANLQNDMFRIPSDKDEQESSEEAVRRGGAMLAELAGHPSWLLETSGRAEFVRNILLLAVKRFPSASTFKEALVHVEDMLSGSAGDPEKRASRAAAKRLLKTRRQDLALWAAYACLEAAAGNMSTARKVFDTTLTSLAALPSDAAHDAPHLFLTYAEMELSHAAHSTATFSPSDQFWASVNDPNSTGHQRALNILTDLGDSATFQPLPVGQVALVPSTRVLKAKKGFKEMLQSTRQAVVRGELDLKGAAIIAASALFEMLTSGVSAAAAVFEDGLAMSLPDKRRRNLQYELLVQRYVDMLEHAVPSVRPARMRQVILRTLADYPCNTQLLRSYVRLESRTAFTNRLRRFFDDMATRNPSTTLWLFAVATEVGRLGAGPRVHSLMEHSLQRSATWQSVLIWRAYLAYELKLAKNQDAARRIFFRAIHTCPWSKSLWMEAFTKLNTVLTAKEQSELADIMREKEIHLRTDVFEILLQEAEDGD